jgi:hypothetical protein
LQLIASSSIAQPDDGERTTTTIVTLGNLGLARDRYFPASLADQISQST